MGQADECANKQVSRFFATKHYGRFLIFNLCEAHEEAGNGNYDCALLYNQVLSLIHLTIETSGTVPFLSISQSKILPARALSQDVVHNR